MPKKRSFRSPQQLWESGASILVDFVEAIFFNLGVTVARHPWKTIVGTLSFVLLSGAGLMRFHLEKNPINLWIPPESDFYYDTNWYIDTFGTGIRMQRVIVSADDVLQPEVLRTLHDVINEVNALQITYQNELLSFKDLCFKVPVVKGSGANENNNIDSDFIDWTLWTNDKYYCEFYEKLQLVCLQNNILDLWNNDLEVLNNLTKHDIVSKINKFKVNPLTGHPLDYAKLLGIGQRDDSGDIVTAKSIILTWYTEVDMAKVDLNEVGNLVGTEEWVSVPLAQWENKFLDYMKYISNNSTKIKFFYEAGRSFADISGDTMFQEMDKLFIGIFLMFFYVIFGLSRCNWVEIKLTLGSVGLLCVGLAYVSAVSWCSIFGVSFGPVHSSLPFLLMGLGIDDMFVMNACWHNLSPEESKRSLPIKVGLMLKHAGVSIVITSFTDIVALLIGAITILPSLKSFCIYAALGVFFIFCYSVTFYVALLTLDIRRMEANRNGILLCYKHKKPIRVSNEKSVLQRIFVGFYRNAVFTTTGKVIVILVVLVGTGFSIQGILRLEQRFDPKWFIPDDTYYKQFLDAHATYYPDEGHMAMVFLGEMNYNEEFPKLYNMVQHIKNESYVDNVITWVEYFHKYVLVNFNLDLKNGTVVADNDFNRYLSRFLYSSKGGRFQMNLKFSEDLKCGAVASRLKASTMVFQFPRFRGPEEYIPAMNNVKRIVKDTNITSGNGYRSVWSKVFGNWVTDEVIGVEVERNIELALLCVMVCTVILITNLQMCLWIFICVLLTIVNVLGCMQRWGMTVDIVCCIGLELAIGLCVDYAAHVGHTFLTVSEGSRSERALKTVTSIGMAVLLGGGSTLLSLSLLSMSKAYTFQSFFKIFLLVILIGLFNGLLFLPVVLSLVGPDAYRPKEKNEEIEMETVELNGKSRLTENSRTAADLQEPGS